MPANVSEKDQEEKNEAKEHESCDEKVRNSAGPETDAVGDLRGTVRSRLRVVEFGEDFVLVSGRADGRAVELRRVVEVFNGDAVVEDFEVFTVEAVVGSGTAALLTLFVTLIAGSRRLFGVLVFTAAVFALFALAVARALGTDAFVETVAGTLCAARVTHAAN